MSIAYRATCWACVIALLTPVVSTFAQTNDDVVMAMQQAEADAAADTSSGGWFAAGCFLGVIGWAAAYVTEPSPPASRLLGKSPEYVAAYTDAYRLKAKNIRASKSLLGCVIGNGCVGVLYVVAVAAAVAAE
jgi:hypothetical protein